MGILVTRVEKEGKLPKCGYCLQKIERGVWQTVKKSKLINNNKNWTETKHYHFSCIGHLSLAEQDQLLAIVNASKEISKNVKKDLEEKVSGAFRKRKSGLNSKDECDANETADKVKPNNQTGYKYKLGSKLRKK